MTLHDNETILYDSARLKEPLFFRYFSSYFYLFYLLLFFVTSQPVFQERYLDVHETGPRDVGDGGAHLLSRVYHVHAERVHRVTPAKYQHKMR